MKKIASFTIDHLKLEPGIYVSRKDHIGSEAVTTFDIRMTRPNFEPVMNTAEIHTIEHLGATFLRNHMEMGDKVVYFGPMGCRTGFYMILAGDYEAKDVVSLVTEMYEFMASYEGDVPGASAKDCGNYLDLNLNMAKYCSRKFLENTLKNIDEAHLVYPDLSVVLSHKGLVNIVIKIGIFGAMDEEVSKLKEVLEETEVVKKASMEFYQGKLYGVSVVIVKSGIGKVNAGICAQMLVDLFDVTAIINTGIAGSLNAKINIGDIVLSSDTLQHDVDAVAFGYELGLIPRMDTLSFKADEDLINLARKECEEVLQEINAFVGRVLSGDQFISNKDKKEWLINTFNGDCVEMEGAAIAQTAHLNNIPFLIIRAISDKADDSAADIDYPTFEAMAIENSVKLLKAMIKAMAGAK